MLYTDGVPVPRNPVRIRSLASRCLANGVTLDTAKLLVNQIRQAAKDRSASFIEDDLSLIVLQFESSETVQVEEQDLLVVE